MNNVMIELETLGYAPNSIILSLAAVRFGNNKLGDEFYEIIDPVSCTNLNLGLDVDMVMWWINQNTKAKKDILKPGQPLPAVLVWFAKWAYAPNVRIWSNNVMFHNTILSNAYEKAKIPRPWHYKDDMCYRTIKNLNPDIKPKEITSKHSSLDKVKIQVKHLMSILKI